MTVDRHRTLEWICDANRPLRGLLACAARSARFALAKAPGDGCRCGEIAAGMAEAFAAGEADDAIAAWQVVRQLKAMQAGETVQLALAEAALTAMEAAQLRRSLWQLGPGELATALMVKRSECARQVRATVGAALDLVRGSDRERQIQEDLAALCARGTLAPGDDPLGEPVEVRSLPPVPRRRTAAAAPGERAMAGEDYEPHRANCPETVVWHLPRPTPEAVSAIVAKIRGSLGSRIPPVFLVRAPEMPRSLALELVAGGAVVFDEPLCAGEPQDSQSQLRRWLDRREELRSFDGRAAWRAGARAFPLACTCHLG